MHILPAASVTLEEHVVILCIHLSFFAKTTWAPLFMPSAQKSLGWHRSVFLSLFRKADMPFTSGNTYILGLVIFLEFFLGGSGYKFLLCFFHSPLRTFWSYIGGAGKIL